MKAKINIVTRLQDNQDGGYSMFCYNNEQELLDDHPMAGDGPNGEPTELQAQLIIGEYDPYENGYIGTETINVIIRADGTVLLDGEMYLHAGQ